MPQVYVGLGSNIDKEIHMAKAVTYFKQQYADLVCSPIYESPAVGFDGESFYNMVVSFTTEQSIDQLLQQFTAQEQRMSVPKRRQRFEPRTIDIDLLLYGDEIHYLAKNAIPRADILNYSFVLKPLADIAGDKLHPILKQTYQQLWQNFNQDICELKNQKRLTTLQVTEKVNAAGYTNIREIEY